MMTAKPGLDCQVCSINSQTEVISILVAYVVQVRFKLILRMHRQCVWRRVSAKKESSISETRYSLR